MEKNINTVNEGQLDLFSFEPEPLEDVIQNVETPKETLSLFDEVESVPTINEHISDNHTKEVAFRPFAVVQIGDNVQVGHPIDDNPESKGYFDYHKGRKGVVLTITENSYALNENYQFYATIQFKNGEEGVFYDLELQVIE